MLTLDLGVFHKRAHAVSLREAGICLFIAAGAFMIEQVHWVIFLFGGILVLTGVTLALRVETYDPSRNAVLRLAKRVLPLTDQYRGSTAVRGLTIERGTAKSACIPRDAGRASRSADRPPADGPGWPHEARCTRHR